MTWMKTNLRRWLFLKAFLRSISSHISWSWWDCFDRPVRGFLLVGHVVQWEMTTQRGWLQGTRPYWVLSKQWWAPGAHVWAATPCRSCPVTVAALNYSRALYDKSNYQLLPLAAVVSTNTNASILTLFDILKMHLESSCHIYVQTVIYQVNQLDSSKYMCPFWDLLALNEKPSPLGWLTKDQFFQNILTDIQWTNGSPHLLSVNKMPMKKKQLWLPKPDHKMFYNFR